MRVFTEIGDFLGGFCQPWCITVRLNGPNGGGGSEKGRVSTYIGVFSRALWGGGGVMKTGNGELLKHNNFKGSRPNLEVRQEHSPIGTASTNVRKKYKPDESAFAIRRDSLRSLLGLVLYAARSLSTRCCTCRDARAVRGLKSVHQHRHARVTIRAER